MPQPHRDLPSPAAPPTPAATATRTGTPAPTSTASGTDGGTDGGTGTEGGTGSGRKIGRRALLAGAVGVPLLGAGGGTLWWRSRHVREPLHSAGVGIRADGQRVGIGPGERVEFVPGSRVLRGGDTSEQVAAEREWLAGGSVPGAGTRWEAMARDALLDLRTLTLDGGAQVAGWPELWRHVWPRDAAFGIAAFAATGHIGDATAMLAFLDRVQYPDGRFEARYRPDGSGPPDDRGVQLDGSGWTLWGFGQLAARLPGDEAGALARRYRPLLDRSVGAATRSLDPVTDLPPVSSDYWEVEEDTLTLGTVAPLLAGLAAAAPLFRLAGDDGAARRAQTAADRLAGTIRANFGPTYPRHLDGDALDAAPTFLTAPIGPMTDDDIHRAQAEATRRSARPAGGVAPGSGWKNDGISWTPETALFALAAAGRGDTATAAAHLDWLAAHRTPLGALPEKVLYDGSPAGPAPLAWTASLVLLTLQTLS